MSVPTFDKEETMSEFDFKIEEKRYGGFSLGITTNGHQWFHVGVPSIDAMEKIARAMLKEIDVNLENDDGPSVS